MAKNTIFSCFHSRRSKIHDKSRIDPDLCEEYINRGLNEKLLPVLRHKSFAQNFCQRHTLNGCCAKRASNLDAKVGLLTLSDPCQHKKYIYIYFTIYFTVLLTCFCRSAEGVGYILYYFLKEVRAMMSGGATGYTGKKVGQGGPTGAKGHLLP